MKPNQLEKSIKIYQQIQQLDKEIQEIDKFAISVSDSDSNSTLKIVHEKKEEKAETKKLKFNEDGSIENSSDTSSIDSMLRGITLSWRDIGIGRSSCKVENKNEISISSDISINTVLSVLSLILYDKIQKRGQLIKKLERFGVVF